MKRSWIFAGLVIVAVVAGVVLIGRNAVKSGSPEAGEMVQSQSPSGAARTGSGASSVAEELPVESGFEFVYTGEELSAPVLALLGLDGKLHDYNSLGAAIAMLPKNDIPSDDEAALREMLTWPNDRFPEGMRPIEINAVKNDVLDRLLRQTELPQEIGLQLVEMASNRENDTVWRDYCIQFMTPFYEKLATYNPARQSRNQS